MKYMPTKKPFRSRHLFMTRGLYISRGGSFVSRTKPLCSVDLLPRPHTLIADHTHICLTYLSSGSIGISFIDFLKSPLIVKKST